MRRVSDLSRRVSRAWVATTGMLCAAAVLFALVNGPTRLDYWAYDRAMALAARPADPDILIVAIDDPSIAAIGFWPWRRAVHAALLDRLHAARAVALDVLFTDVNPQYPQDDALLAQAIARHGRVALPVVLEAGGASVRLGVPPELARSPARFGYINIESDPDGVVRSVRLRTQAGGHAFEHLVPALMAAGGEGGRAEAAAREAAGGSRPISYAGPPGHFRSVSYLSVLRGEVDDDTLRGKYVLVGSWATALNDAFLTPVSRQGPGMSGIEILANVLQNVREDTVLRTLPAWQHALLSALPVLLLCLAMRRLSPRPAFFCALGAMALTALAAALLMRAAGLWLPPSAALVVLALCYPVWSWRSQEAALRDMDAEFLRLSREVPAFPEAPEPVAGRGPLDVRLGELQQALDRVRNLRRFLADVLGATPDPTLVFDPDGILRFRNAAALAHAAAVGAPAPQPGDAAGALVERIVPDPQARLALRRALGADAPAGEAAADAMAQALWHQGLEVRDARGRDLLVKCVPMRTGGGGLAGTVLILTDVWAIRQAEREREQTLRFLSHDMRAPQNEILALIDLQAHEATRLSEHRLLERVAQSARRTLALADGFVQLTRAESGRFEFVPVELADLLAETMDEHWAAARARGIALDTQVAGPAFVRGDRGLLARAFGNLVGNALKYAPPGTAVRCALARRDGWWEVRLSDAGPGIPAAERDRLFLPFVRIDTREIGPASGAGLGLAFVHAAVSRHGGAVAVRDAVPHGAEFVVRLPADDEPEDAPQPAA